MTWCYNEAYYDEHTWCYNEALYIRAAGHTQGLWGHMMRTHSRVRGGHIRKGYGTYEFGTYEWEGIHEMC